MTMFQWDKSDKDEAQHKGNGSKTNEQTKFQKLLLQCCELADVSQSRD